MERRAGDGAEVEVWHRQESFILDARLGATLGLTPVVALSLELPLRLFHTSIRYEDDAGRAVPILNASVHHRDETLVGLGDPRVGARLATRVGDWTLAANLGLRLPVGKIEPNPYGESAAATPHQHFQFGSGTVDPELGLAVDHDFGDASLGLWLFGRWALYEGRYGYEAGDRYAAGLVVGSDLGLDAWRFTAAVEAQAELAERWNGLPPVDDGNQGRFDLYAALGATVRPSDDLFIGLTARVPMYTYIVGGQLELPIVLELSIGGNLQLWEDDAPADVVAPDPHTGGDVAATTTPTPVPGKLTVIDYAADWCAPCAVLAQHLATLAADHPALAVRRLDVGDEPPAGMTLPHVVVFDPSGVEIYRGEGDPALIAEDVRLLLDGARPPSRLPAPPPGGGRGP